MIKMFLLIFMSPPWNLGLKKTSFAIVWSSGVTIVSGARDGLWKCRPIPVLKSTQVVKIKRACHRWRKKPGLPLSKIAYCPTAESINRCSVFRLEELCLVHGLAIEWLPCAWNVPQVTLLVFIVDTWIIWRVGVDFLKLGSGWEVWAQFHYTVYIEWKFWPVGSAWLRVKCPCLP